MKDTKTQIFVAKGYSPWFNGNWGNGYYENMNIWEDSSHVVSVDESVPGQATVTCDGNITNMSYIFNLTHLTSLDLSSFDASNVTNMRSMFEGCLNLTSLNLSNFNTSNVTTMEWMFSKCCNITSIDLSNINTSNVTNMDGMFSYCDILTKLDLSSFNTSKVEDMSFMFGFSENLITLDLSKFDTSKVKYMGGMFYHCSKLTSVDLSNFDTSNVTNMSGMFNFCTNLTTIKGVIDMKSCTEECYDMFKNCHRLKDVKIKNPPANFDEAGLSKSQYTIIS